MNLYFLFEKEIFPNCTLKRIKSKDNQVAMSILNTQFGASQRMLKLPHNCTHLTR